MMAVMTMTIDDDDSDADNWSLRWCRWWNWPRHCNGRPGALQTPARLRTISWWTTEPGFRIINAWSWWSAPVLLWSIWYPTTHSRKQIKRIEIKKTHSLTNCNKNYYCDDDYCDDDTHRKNISWNTVVRPRCVLVLNHLSVIFIRSLTKPALS